MPSPFAKEYTPELSDEYLQSLLRPIEASRGRRRGAFRREALERGLTGDPYEASGVQGIETGVDTQKSNLASQFAYNRAGLQREERLLGEGREYGSAEAEKSRVFAGQQAEAERQLRRELGQRQDEGDEFLSNLLGIGSQVVGGAIGGYFGGPAGAGAGSQIGGSIGKRIGKKSRRGADSMYDPEGYWG